ncbi:MAG: RraA family protein, partial [Desulfitobacteriaceae bacterium]|nr:RraA family protein [Desulfitobacteriaceae bacterium]
MPVGSRIYMRRNMPPKEILEGFKNIPTANIADCMGRLYAMSSRIRLMTAPSEANMVGVALTVKAPPGDNLLIHQSLNMIQAGDVLIISNGFAQSQSLLGEVAAAYAKFKKAAGIVLDGPVRDVQAMYNMGIPVYATGSTPGGPYKEGPGEINVPIACGSISINPGDIIVGDSDGVIVIPLNDAVRVLEDAKEFTNKDREKVLNAYKGTLDRTWVEKAI